MITVFNRKILVQSADYEQIQKISDRLKNQEIEFYITRKNRGSDINRRAYTGITQSAAEVTEYTVYVSGKNLERAESCL